MIGTQSCLGFEVFEKSLHHEAETDIDITT